MSLQLSSPAEVPSQTAAVARAAFPRGNVYMRLRDELGTVCTDAQFTALFSARGRPAEAPWRLALVTVLQFAENLSIAAQPTPLVVALTGSTCWASTSPTRASTLQS